MILHPCIECEKEMMGSHTCRKFCSLRCKGRYRKKHPNGKLSNGHDCRTCGKHFSLKKGQANKWLCSDKCRRASNAKSVREFHKRRPKMEAVYRMRTKEKMPPDSQHRRFYRLNPDAPHACQSCGEKRVLEIAHRPECPRLGERRSSKNMKWPEMVWILCPTCHRLLDRMHYSMEDLGLF